MSTSGIALVWIIWRARSMRNCTMYWCGDLPAVLRAYFGERDR